MKFLATTYWNNEPALKCQLAAMILALRGRNVEWEVLDTGTGGCWTVPQHGPYREYVRFQPLVCGYEHLLYAGRIPQAGRGAHWEVRGHRSGSSLNRMILERGLVQEPHDRRAHSLQAQLRRSYTLDLFHRVETVRDEPVVDIPGRYRRDLPIHDETHSSHITKGPIRTSGRARQDVLPWGRRHFVWVFPVGQRVEGPEGPCSVVTVSDCVHNF